MGPSFNTQFDITSSQSGSPYPALGFCPKTGGGVVTFLDSSNNVQVCGLGQTSVTLPCFTLSTSPAFVSTVPCVACSSSGPCMGAWTDASNAKVMVSFFQPDTGAIIASPAQANTAVTTTAGAPICGFNSDGTFQLSWSATSSGSFQFTQTAYSTAGVRQYTPTVVNTNPTIQQGGTCMVPLAGSPPTSLGVIQEVSGTTKSVLTRVIFANNGTAVTSPQTLVSQTTTSALIGSPCDKFTNGDVIVCTHTNSGTNPVCYTVSPTTAAQIGSSYQLSVAAGNIGGVAGLQNGNALLVVDYNGSAYGGMFDPSGASQCTPFKIPVTSAGGQGSGPVISLGGSASNPVALSVYSDGSTSKFQARTITFSQSSSTTTPPPTTTAAPTSSPTSSPATTTVNPTTSGPAPTTASPTTSVGTSSPGPSTTAPATTAPATTKPATTSPSSAASILTSSPAQVVASLALTAVYWLIS